MLCVVFNIQALAMGVGEFLSSKAENEWILSERRRENWEMENCKLCCNAYHKWFMCA